MGRTLSVIGAPSSAGAYAPGQEKASTAFREHGLLTQIERAGIDVVDRGDTPSFRWRPDLDQPKQMNLQAVADTAAAVADLVAEAFHADHAVLVLGGDCTVTLGTVAGALRAGSSVGLVYIDFDVDLNTPEHSDGALDWTGVAHLLSLPGTAEALSGLGPRRPMMPPQDVLLFAASNITPFEAEQIDALGIEVVSMAEVKADPTVAARRAAEWGRDHDALLVHVDIDVLSYIDFPIAENTRREGLAFAELSAVLPVLLSSPNWRALTIAEVNPDHAPDVRETFSRLNEMLVEALP